MVSRAAPLQVQAKPLSDPLTYRPSERQRGCRVRQWSSALSCRVLMRCRCSDLSPSCKFSENLGEGSTRYHEIQRQILIPGQHVRCGTALCLVCIFREKIFPSSIPVSPLCLHFPWPEVFPCIFWGICNTLDPREFVIFFCRGNHPSSPSPVGLWGTVMKFFLLQSPLSLVPGPDGRRGKKKTGEKKRRNETQ